MKLIIDNNLTLLNISEKLRQWLFNTLQFKNPLFEEAIRNNRYVGNIPEFISMGKLIPNGIIIPRGYLKVLEKGLLEKNIYIEIIDNRVLTKPISISTKIKLRDYQLTAKYNLLKHTNGILVAPAGSGKTIIGLDLFSTLKQKTLWITHTNRLAEQVIDRYHSFIDITDNRDVGFIGGGQIDIGNKFTVALVQTLVRRNDYLMEIGRTFGLVIVDECHHCPSTTFTKVVSEMSSFYLYGLTATPIRRDKLENLMFASIGDINAWIPRKVVKEIGAIVPTKVIKRVVPSELSNSNNYAYVLSKLVMPNTNRLNIIINDILNEAKKGNYCIVISIRKSYCEILYEIISKTYKKVGIATGDYSKEHNAKQIENLENDKINILITTFHLLGEGFDVPKLNRGFLVLPFKEAVRTEQAIGRIQRPYKDKTEAIMYDYVDDNIGILRNQFWHRAMVYGNLGIDIIE